MLDYPTRENITTTNLESNFDAIALPKNTEKVLEIINSIESVEVKLKNAVKELVADTIAKVTQRYGKDGQGAKPFHDGDHTVDVILDGIEIFDKYAKEYPALTSKYKLLAIMAFAGHDSVQSHNPYSEIGANEAASIRELREDISSKRLREQGLISDGDLISLDKMLTATTYDIENHRQLLSNSQIASTDDVLERVIALADMRDIGVWRKQHWRGNRFFWELHGEEYEEAKSRNDTLKQIGLVKKWFMEQQNFITKHIIYLEQFGPIGKEIYPDFIVNSELYNKLIERAELLESQFRENPDSTSIDQALRQLLTKDEQVANNIKESL